MIYAGMPPHMPVDPERLLKSYRRYCYVNSSLAITQVYLGKISNAEAIRWIDNLHG